jgi:hypothetical protein
MEGIVSLLSLLLRRDKLPLQQKYREREEKKSLVKHVFPAPIFFLLKRNNYVSYFKLPF